MTGTVRPAPPHWEVIEMPRPPLVASAVLAGLLLPLVGCQNDPSPLPPPPIASYGNEGALDGRIPGRARVRVTGA